MAPQVACFTSLLFALIWAQTVSCTVQLQPISRLAAFQAHGSFVLNGRRTIAAGTAVNTSSVLVLQQHKGTWSLADVVSPPESDQVDFLPGSIMLSSDGRILAVAATPKASRTPATLQHQGVIAGYIYRIVAQSHSNSGFRYQLAGKLTLPVSGQPSSDSTSSNTAGQVITSMDMSADGQTVLACWTHKADMSAGSAVPSATGGLSGGASVFTWRGFGQVLHAVHLPVPPGSRSFGHSCKLSADGRTALVLDSLRGAMVYSREAHTPRGSTAAYRAAGWLAGAPAQQQYRVLAAALSPTGRQAALLVNAGAGASGGSAALKVFAADVYGHWADVCSTPLSNPVVQSGALRLAPFSGGVHVWATQDGVQLMYAVGLDGGQATHCPSQPTVSSVLAPAQPAVSIATWHKSQSSSSVGVRTGSLIVGAGDSEARYVSLE